MLLEVLNGLDSMKGFIELTPLGGTVKTCISINSINEFYDLSERETKILYNETCEIVKESYEQIKKLIIDAQI